MPRPFPPCVIEALQREEWFPDPSLCRSARVQILRLPHFRGAPAAMTFGSLILFFRPDYWHPTDPAGLALIAHELWHVHQYRAEGYLRFSVKYAREWLVLTLQRKKIHDHLSYEVEAVRFQRTVEAELRREAAANGGAGPCLGQADQPKINPSYRKIKLARWVP